MKKPVNYSIKEVTQVKEINPALFLRKSKEVFRKIKVLSADLPLLFLSLKQEKPLP